MAKAKSDTKSEAKSETTETTTQKTVTQDGTEQNEGQPQPTVSDPSKRVPVEFLQHDGPYNPGEIAGFVEPVATRLIEAGKAKLYEPTA